MLGEFNSPSSEVKNMENMLCLHNSYCMNHWFFFFFFLFLLFPVAWILVWKILFLTLTF